MKNLTYKEVYQFLFQIGLLLYAFITMVVMTTSDPENERETARIIFFSFFPYFFLSGWVAKLLMVPIGRKWGATRVSPLVLKNQVKKIKFDKKIIEEWQEKI